MKIEKTKLEQLLRVFKKALTIGAGGPSYANTLPGDMSGAVVTTTESLARKKKKKRKQKHKGENVEKSDVEQVIKEDEKLLSNLAKAEKIPGGKAAGRPDSDFDPKQLAMGIKVEMEHTKDKTKAKEIAKDHLAEISDYYTRLKTMEDKAKKEGIKKGAIVVKDPKDKNRQFEVETTKEGKKKLVFQRDGKGSVQGSSGRGMGPGKGKNKIKGCDLLSANDDISRQKRKQIFKAILKEVKERFPETDYQTIIEITTEKWQKKLLQGDSDTTSESDNKQ